MTVQPYSAEEVDAFRAAVEVDPAAGNGEWSRWLATFDAARAEVDGLNAELLSVRSFNVRDDGRLDFSFKGELLTAFSTFIVGFYRQSSATNYIEFQVRDPKNGEAFVLTVQRKYGKTPHEFRKVAEERAAALESALTSARKMVAEARSSDDLQAAIARLFAALEGGR